MAVHDLYVSPTSKLTPAVAALGVFPYIAWTGSDDNVYLGWYGTEGPVASPLGVTSKAGPGLATGDGVVFVAWTGESSEEVNVSATRNGVTFTRHKTGESTPHTPAAAYFASELWVAFTGESSNVYVMKVPDGERVKVATGAVAGPSLAVYGGRLYLAWPSGNGVVSLSVSSDGTNWSDAGTHVVGADLAPALAATVDALFLVWSDGAVRAILIDGTGPITVDASSTSVAPAAVGIGHDLLVVWAQTNEDVRSFSISDAASSLAVPRPRSGDEVEGYITAATAVWGLTITLSPQAVSDVEDGANVIAGVAGALAAQAGLIPPQVGVACGIVSGVLWAGASVLALVDRGDGVSLLVPWTSFLPMPAPFGPGGIVIPVPAGSVSALASAGLPFPKEYLAPAPAPTQ